MLLAGLIIAVPLEPSGGAAVGNDVESQELAVGGVGLLWPNVWIFLEAGKGHSGLRRKCLEPVLCLPCHVMFLIQSHRLELESAHWLTAPFKLFDLFHKTFECQRMYSPERKERWLSCPYKVGPVSWRAVSGHKHVT